MILFLSQEALLCLIERLALPLPDFVVVFFGLVRHLNPRTKRALLHHLLRLHLLVLQRILLQPQFLPLLRVPHPFGRVLVNFS